MPYCPKCDMEFIEGMTTCTDCGGPLVESKEVADAMKKKEKEEALARQHADFETAEYDELSPAAPYGDAPFSREALGQQSSASRPERTSVYVKKSQQYDDLKSSATAFLLVGGVLFVFSLLCWAGIVPLPMAGVSGILSRSVMTVLGLGALAVAWHSSRSAKKISGQIADEERVTHELIDWFTKNYTGDRLDAQIRGESGELSPEELSLKRFELIQDLLITNHDITDQAYVDALAEDIYSRLYED